LDKSKRIIDQIKADKHNIQELVNMLPTAKKTHYNQIQSTIKTLVREIKYQKDLIADNVYQKDKKCCKALFEAIPSDIEQVDLDDISAFFGILDDID
jgi:hypothetical protein